MSTEVHLELMRIADEVSSSIDADKHHWEHSMFLPIRQMSPDKTGEAGEFFVGWMLEQCGRTAINSRQTNPAKQWDIEVPEDGVTLEVKTATLGFRTNTFQHEGLDKHRQCDAIVLVDIAPNQVFVTMEARAAISWEKLHLRRDSGNYKYDLRLSALIENEREIRSIVDFRRLNSQIVWDATLSNELKDKVLISNAIVIHRVTGLTWMLATRSWNCTFGNRYRRQNPSRCNGLQASTTMYPTRFQS